jgi:hypothetical protein
MAVNLGLAKINIENQLNATENTLISREDKVRKIFGKYSTLDK